MKTNRLIRQHDTRDCGAACLCMICHYFRKDYTIQQLRKLTNTSQEGVSIWGIVEASDKLGITAEGFSGSIAELKQFVYESKTPIMLHMNNNHYVVGVKGDGKYIYIYDPAKGKYKIAWNELKNHWSGYIISFSDRCENVVLEETKDKRGKYNAITDIIKEHKFSLIWILVLSLVIFGITICGNYVFQLLIDNGGNLVSHHGHEHDENIIVHLLETISNNNLYALLAYMVFLFSIMSLITWFRGKCVATMTQKIDISLIKRYVKKISNATIQDISSRMQGEYMTRISDLLSLRRVITDLLVAVILDGIMIIISIFILADVNSKLLLISLVGMSLYILVAIVLKDRMKNANYKIMNDNAEMQSFFKEFIQGIEVVKANNQNKSIEEKFLDKYKKYADSVYYGNMLGVASGSLATLIEQLSNIFVIILGFVMVEEKIISLGELFTFYMFLACVTEPIKDILSLQSTFQSGMVALERLEDIRYMEDERTDGTKLPEEKMSIVVKAVGFCYPGKKQLFQKVSFAVSGEDKVVLLGENGVGKSTLIKLIMGMEKCVEGNIEINGIDIREIDLSDLRNKISYVTQSNFLFADTLKNNITFGDDCYTQEELEKVCEIAGLQDMINNMPRGYDTYINENGGNMSMGQRQAIAIARALIRKPQLLILDEATSNMDEEREKYVMNNIANLPIPCIIISHSAYISEKFDKKVKLEANSGE